MFMRVPLAMLAAAVVFTTHAQAADNIRYVSTTGSNANACTLVAPCRTFQRGVNTTPTGGELRILDSGDYGVNANVNRSMTISANGHTVILGNPIIINNADAVVALRGLVLDGQGAVADGIRINAAAAMHIERCFIRGFTGQGIRVASSNVDQVFVVDSTVRDNGVFGFNGQVASRVTIDNSHFHNNINVGVLTGANTTIHRSTASGNSFGIFVTSASTTSVMSVAAVQNGAGFVVSGGSLTADSSVAHGNDGQGLSVSAGGTARISNSTFTNNVTGIQNDDGSTVETRQNNTVRGNTTNVIGTLTAIGGI